MSSRFSSVRGIKDDLSASVVVFLVALPLCLGIGLASTGRPDLVFAGVIKNTQKIHVGVNDHVCNVAMHEYLTRIGARNLVCRNAAVRAANPKYFRTLALCEAFEEIRILIQLLRYPPFVSF